MANTHTLELALGSESLEGEIDFSQVDTVYEFVDFFSQATEPQLRSFSNFVVALRSLFDTFDSIVHIEVTEK